jgi:hypothetical protein
MEAIAQTKLERGSDPGSIVPGGRYLTTFLFEWRWAEAEEEEES